MLYSIITFKDLFDSNRITKNAIEYSTEGAMTVLKMIKAVSSSIFPQVYSPCLGIVQYQIESYWPEGQRSCIVIFSTSVLRQLNVVLTWLSQWADPLHL